MAISEIQGRIDDCVALVLEVGLAEPADLKPATPSDLESLSRRYPSLPAAYRFFLERVGRGAGALLQGTDAFAPEILELDPKEAVEDVSDGQWHMGPFDVLFASHQGYSLVILGGPADDPPVFRLHEADVEPVLIGQRFTEWLFEYIREEAAQWGGKRPERQERWWA